MKSLGTFILSIFLLSGSYGQDLADYLEIIKLRDKNDSLVKKFDLGTAPRAIPVNHYFKVEYIMNTKGALENDIAIALESRDGAINYKSFSAGGFPVLFYLGTRTDFMGQPLPGTMKADEYPMSALPVSFPETYSLAAVNEKTTIHIAIYKFSPRNIKRIDSLKAVTKSKGIKDNFSRQEKAKNYLAKEEAQRQEKESKRAELEKFNENVHTILELEKLVNQKYIIESKLKKKMLFNKGYEVLYLKYLKIEIGVARQTKDKINYQNKVIVLFNKMIKLLDVADTKDLEKKLEEQKDVLKIQAIFDGVPQ